MRYYISKLKKKIDILRGIIVNNKCTLEYIKLKKQKKNENIKKSSLTKNG